MLRLRIGLMVLICLAAPQGLHGQNPAPPGLVRTPALDAHGDPLPEFARARLGTLRFRQGSRVNWVRFSPDGRALLTIDWDSIARVWDPATGKESYHFKLPDPYQHEWLLTPDHRVLVTWSNGRSIRVWETASNKLLREISSDDHKLGPACLAPDDRTLVAGVVEKTTNKLVIRLWDLPSGKELRDIVPIPPKDKKEPFVPHELRLAAEGKVLLGVQTLSRGWYTEDQVRLWDFASGKELPAPEEGPSASAYPALAPNGKFAARLITNKDQSMRWCLTDLATGAKLRDLEQSEGSVGLLHTVFSPDGRKLLALDSSHLLHLWDTSSGKRLPAPPDFNLDNSVRYFAVAPDSQTIAIGAVNAKLGLYEVASGKLLRELKGYCVGRTRYAEPIIFPNLAFSPDGKLLAAAGGDNLVRIWSTADGKEITPVSAGHEGGVCALAVAPDERMIASAGDDDKVRLWEVATGRELWVQQLVIRRSWHSDMGVSGLAFSPDGKTVVAGTHNGTVHVWEATTGRQRLQFQTPEGFLSALAFTTDGRRLLVGGSSIVRCYDPVTGRAIDQFAPADFPQEKREATPLMMAISADGRLLATAERQPRCVRLWELSTGKLRKQLPEPEREERAFTDQPERADNQAYARYQHLPFVIFAPDGKTLAWNWTGTIHLLDLTRGKEVRRFGGQARDVTGIAFSPVASLLAASSEDGTVRLWDVATGTILGDLKAPRGGFLSLAFSPDGRTLITGGADTTILLWDVPRILKQWQAGPAGLAPGELNDLWNRLASRKDTEATVAMDRLETMPHQSVPLLRDRLRPTPPVDAQRVAALLADLDSDRFEVRGRATEELEKLAEQAGPFLRKRLEQNPPLEARKRIGQLLEGLSGFAGRPEQVQALRAVEVLERIGTPEAQAMLKALAEGAPDARLTQDAKASLERLAR